MLLHADEGDSCAQGALRLVGARYSGERRLELCSGGVWGTESQRYVSIVREYLVYNKYSGHRIGFTSLDDLNSYLSCHVLNNDAKKKKVYYAQLYPIMF